MKNILKRIYLPVFLPLSWIIYLLSLSSGILRLKYYLSPTSKLFRLIGLAASVFWHFRLLFLILFVIVFFIEFVRVINSKNKLSDKLYLIIVGILCFISFLLANKLLGIQAENYPNYLYVKYGLILEDIVTLSDISTLVLISVVGFLIFIKGGVLHNLRKLQKEISKMEVIIPIVGLLILIWFAVSPIIHFRSYINYAKKDYKQIFSDYKYIDQLSFITPKDSKIIIPIQNMTWSAIGNPLIVRYFLYPRTIVSSSYITDNNLDTINKAYFIEIGKENDENYWPNINFKGKTIIFNKEKVYYKTLTLFSSEDGIDIYFIEF